ncbi:MAG: glycosyltransferase [Bacteroidales bacterium]|nr:glycosyltransferase [Bacteroidales bacterium]
MNKEDDVRFSVVVPLYNKETYIRRTLESILTQTFVDYELIVVDDGSTDDSFATASNFLAGNIKSKVVKQKNKGVAVARNNGVSLSHGEFICFLDSDDWWEPSFLEEMDRLIRMYPDAGLYGTAFFLIKNGKKKVAPIGVDNEFCSGYINYCQTYARTLCMPISSSSVAIPKVVFNEFGGFRGGISLGEDFDLWIRIALKNQVALINKPLSNYFQDIPPHKRATRRLHNPKNHMLWNLDYLSQEETSNKDLAILLDRLRASGLYRYYLSRQYHDQALEIISKIDWSHVSQKIYSRYHTPLFFQRCVYSFRCLMVRIKSLIISL